MSETIELGSYHCRIFSTREDDARILVNNAAGTNVGSLHFVVGADALPAAQEIGGVYHLYFRRSSYVDIVDILRNESPVYLVYSTEGINNSCIMTSTGEPVGENE